MYGYILPIFLSLFSANDLVEQKVTNIMQGETPVGKYLNIINAKAFLIHIFIHKTLTKQQCFFRYFKAWKEKDVYFS